MRCGAVDILQEQVQRHDALRQSGLQAVPFESRDDARDQVEGKEAFRAAAVAVDGEGDALQQERQIRQAAALFEFGRG